MTQPPDRDEEQLQALFDATAPEPDEQQLQRLARYAAAVPEAKRSGWLARMRWWMPALPLAAAALLGLLWWGQRAAPGDGGGKLASTSASAPAARSAERVAGVIEQWEPADDEEAWALAGGAAALLGPALHDGGLHGGSLHDDAMHGGSPHEDALHNQGALRDDPVLDGPNAAGRQEKHGAGTENGLAALGLLSLPGERAEHLDALEEAFDRLLEDG